MIELAVDNTGTVTEFPVLNLRDVARMAREFADTAERGELGEIQSAMLVLETESGVQTFHWGDNLSLAEAIGVIELAKARFINEAFRGDDD
jgi:hypothetical protein